MQKFVQKSQYSYITCHLLTGSNTLQIQISMADIPDMAPIFIKQYLICLYIREVLIIWDSRILIVYL